MSFDLYENYRSLASAILMRYVRDYMLAYIYTTKHTEDGLEDKLRRSISAARKAQEIYGPESKEYEDANKLIKSWKWKMSVYRESLNTLETVEYEIRTGSLSSYFRLLGYKLDDNTIIDFIKKMAKDPSRRRSILNAAGRPEVPL